MRERRARTAWHGERNELQQPQYQQPQRQQPNTCVPDTAGAMAALHPRADGVLGAAWLDSFADCPTRTRTRERAPTANSIAISPHARVNASLPVECAPLPPAQHPRRAFRLSRPALPTLCPPARQPSSPRGTWCRARRQHTHDTAPSPAHLALRLQSQWPRPALLPPRLPPPHRPRSASMPPTAPRTPTRKPTPTRCSQSSPTCSTS